MTTGGPVPDADRRLLAAPSPLPESVEVAVVGGGLTGIAVAGRLAAAGVSVLVLEAGGDLGWGFASRSAGLVLPGTQDHAARLVEAVGEADAVGLLTWSAQALARAAALGLRPGALELAWSDGEAADLDAGRAPLADAGLGAEAWDAAAVASMGWSGAVDRPGGALYCPQGGTLRPRAALAGLWSCAAAAGARAVTGARVCSIDSGPVLRLADGRSIACDAVVLTAGWRLRAVDEWFGDKLYPVRHQHQLRQGGPGLIQPISTQGGYLWAVPRGANAMVVGGARWATQHLEAGETDDTVVQPLVAAAQDRFVAARLPGWASAVVAMRWSGIATHTCDNLPIVGPLPGRPSVLCCTGWNGRPWAWSLAAADAVADGLLTGHAHGVPTRVSARRFLG